MKQRKQHRVPLSCAPLAVLREARDDCALREARQRSGESDLVFPTERGRVFYGNALSKLVAALSIACVPHGFRSSFRDWAAETRIDFDVGEICLAHSVGSLAGTDCRHDASPARSREHLAGHRDERWGSHCSVDGLHEMTSHPGAIWRR